MGVGYGLTRALMADVEGAQAGQADQRELERQARQDLLKERLLNARVSDFEAQAKQRLQPPKGEYSYHAAPSGTYRFNSATGLRERIGEGEPRAGGSKLQHLVDPVTGQVYGYDPESNTVIPASLGQSGGLAQQQSTPSASAVPPKGTPLPRPGASSKQPVRLGVKPTRPIAGTDAEGNTLLIDPNTHVASPVTGAAKPLSTQERTAGSQESSAEQSVAALESIAARNPEAARAAVAAIQAGGWGRAGKAYAALRGFTSQKDANDFYTEYKNMLLAVTPTYGGARPTQQLMELEQQATLPALGSGDFTSAFHHMRNRLNDLRAKSRQPRKSGAGSSDTPSPPVNPRFDPRKQAP